MSEDLRRHGAWTRAEARSAGADVIVIGGGPAGSVAAHQIKRRDPALRVVLVERKAFPRDKVCGCCVNGAARATLRACGLEGVMQDAVPTRRLRVMAGERCATLPLAGGGSAIGRDLLDARLLAAAAGVGVEVRQPASAEVVRIDIGGVSVNVNGEAWLADRVVVADGLGGGSLRRVAGFEPRVRPGSRMGIGAVLPGGDIEPGMIHMACGRHGYVGLVRLGDGRVDVAAAVDAGWVKAAGGPGEAVRQVLAEAGGEGLSRCIEPAGGAAWKGVGLLTRRRAVAGERVLVVGDAAGYVEPFTGEGMAWAMAAGWAVAPLAAGAWRASVADEWVRTHGELARRRQRVCGAVAWLLRRPGLTRGAVGVLGLVGYCGGWRMVPGLSGATVVGDGTAGKPAAIWGGGGDGDRRQTGG